MKTEPANQTHEKPEASPGRDSVDRPVRNFSEWLVAAGYHTGTSDVQEHLREASEAQRTARDGVSCTALFDRLVDAVIIPWREQAARAEQDGDEQRREILDGCCEDLEAFISANAQDQA